MTREETIVYLQCQRISAGCESLAMIADNDIAAALGKSLPHNATDFREIPYRFGIASDQVKAAFAKAVV